MEIDWKALNRHHKVRCGAHLLGFPALTLSLVPLIIVLLRPDVGRCWPDPCAAGCDPVRLLLLFVAGLCLVVVALSLIWFALPTRFVRVLRDSPERVVWLYVDDTDRRSTALVAGLDDGRGVRLEIGAFDRSLIDAIAARVPHASLGYSDQQLAIFASAPRRLRPNTRT
jgi:hypothetical protein